MVSWPYMAVGFECFDELKSYACGSLGTDRVSHDGYEVGGMVWPFRSVVVHGLNTSLM